MTVPADMRREALWTWMYERPERYGLTTEEIVDLIGHPYDKVGHYRYSRCFDDLKALERQGSVVRLPGRPARWTL